MSNAQSLKVKFEKAEVVKEEGLIVSDPPFDILVNLAEGRFFDAAENDLGDDMPFFILKHEARFGIPPWDKEDQKPQMYGETWIVPVGGKMASCSNLVCRLFKKQGQLSGLGQAALRCASEHASRKIEGVTLNGYQQVVWQPNFVRKNGVDADGKQTKYYKFGASYRSPESDLEWETLFRIIELKKEHPELDNLRDSTMSDVLYMKDLTPEQRLEIAGSRVIKPQLPTAPAAAALPESNGYSDNF